MKAPRPGLSTTVRTLGAAAAATAILLGSWLALRTAPRLTLTNVGLQFASAPLQPLQALCAAAGALTLVVLFRGRLVRALAVLGAAGFFALAFHLWLFGVTVGPDALETRGLWGRGRVAWTEVTRVDDEGPALTLEGRSGNRVSVDTSRMAPTQRASLERAVARHIATAQMPPPPPRPEGGEPPPR